jgi:integrase
VTVTAARSAVKGADPLYAAYALILVLSLRRGQVLGLKSEHVDLNAGELHVGWQLQTHRRSSSPSRDQDGGV